MSDERPTEVSIRPCPHCGVRIVPTMDGMCPSCGRAIGDATSSSDSDGLETVETDVSSAWDSFKRRHDPGDPGASIPEPVEEVRRAESAFLDDPRFENVLRYQEVDAAMADRIERELLPVLADRIASTSSDASDADEVETSALDWMRGRERVWRGLVEALRTGETERFEEFESRWRELEMLGMEVFRPPESASTRGAVKDGQLQFERALVSFTPRVVVVPFLVIVNVAVFLAMTIASGDWLMPTPRTAIDWGANFAPLTRSGQWWRLVTAGFLHFGLMHLAFNMWILFALGKLLERLVGNVGFAIVYMSTLVIASLCSLAFHAFAACAGASGAVFGVCGALLGYIVLRRDTIPLPVLQNIRSNMTGFIVVNLLFGFTVPGIDNAAHIGGLVSGFLLGLALSQPLDTRTLSRRPGRNLRAVTAGLVVGVAGFYALPAVSVDVGAEFKAFAESEARILATFQEIATEIDRGEPADEAARRLSLEVIHPWTVARERLAKIRDIRGIDAKVIDGLLEYAEAREQCWTALWRFLREGDPGDWQEFDRLRQRAEELARAARERAGQ